MVQKSITKGEGDYESNFNYSCHSRILFSYAALYTAKVRNKYMNEKCLSGDRQTH